MKIASSHWSRPDFIEQDAGLSLGFQPHPVKAKRTVAKLLWEMNAGVKVRGYGTDAGLAPVVRAENCDSEGHESNRLPRMWDVRGQKRHRHAYIDWVYVHSDDSPRFL
ncbi:MAG: hypothetical protein ABR987_14105 [Terracidiphilus sp.]